MVAILIALAGCASEAVREPVEQVAIDSQNLVYGSVVLEFVGHSAVSRGITTESAGGAAKEGAELMLAAPVGCMQAGVLYGFCLAMAPFFPLIAANRVQDPENARQELEALALHISSADLQERFRERVEELALVAELPVIGPELAGIDSARLRLELGAMRLDHSGYKNGSITLTQPYRFELRGAGGQILGIIAGEKSGRVDVDEWPKDSAAGLAEMLNDWISRLALAGLQDTLVEWQPEVFLAPRSPLPVSKRNMIGIRQERWPFVESTRPKLLWQPLEEVFAPEILARVTDVTYEIEVTGGGLQGYNVVGLTEPAHELGVELLPCTTYNWIPRARFRYRDVIHTTSLRTRAWSETVMLDHPFRIYTPAPGCSETQWRSGPVEPVVALEKAASEER